MIYVVEKIKKPFEKNKSFYKKWNSIQSYYFVFCLFYLILFENYKKISLTTHWIHDFFKIFFIYFLLSTHLHRMPVWCLSARLA